MDSAKRMASFFALSTLMAGGRTQDELNSPSCTSASLFDAGGEIGVRTQAVSGLESSLSLFVLDFNSELVFAGDAGNTEASRPSRRTGVEWTTTYKPAPWLGLELDVAATRARDRIGRWSLVAW